MNQDDIQLRNIDPDDIGDVICKIEKSFGIKLNEDDLIGVCNFGQLCDAALNKIGLPNTDDCTWQQAFYKLRSAIQQVKGIDKTLLTPSLGLDDIFPKNCRRKEVKRVAKIIGLPLKILQPKQWVAKLLFISLIPAFILLFFNWIIGLSAFCFLMACGIAANYFGREFKVYTVGEIAEYMTLVNYKKVRRNPETINKKEVERIMKVSFMADLSLPEEALTRDAQFN